MKRYSAKKIVTKIDNLKSEASSSINKKLSPINSNNSLSSSNQTSDNTNKWPLLKSPDLHSHASHFTKHLSSTTLEGNTLLQLQNVWNAICYAFCKVLPTKEIWPPCKKLKAENYNIIKFILQPDTCSKYIT